MDYSRRGFRYKNKIKGSFDCLCGQLCFQHNDRPSYANRYDEYRLEVSMQTSERQTVANRVLRYYYLFIVCNFTNAIFFWLLLPETARRPLEEMNALFEHAPWIVVGRSKDSYQTHDLENIEQEIIETKRSASHAESIVR